MIRPPPSSSFFFFNDTATTEIYTLSLHDALPIYPAVIIRKGGITSTSSDGSAIRCRSKSTSCAATRSEELTSELQSPCNLVCRLLLEKKKNANRCSQLHPRPPELADISALARAHD